MEKHTQLALAQEQGYIIGSRSKINSIQNEYYKWCKQNNKPYITLTTRGKHCHFSLDTPSAKLRLNRSGIAAIKDLLEKHSDTTEFHSIGREQIFHDKISVLAAPNLAKEAFFIFQDEKNCE